MKEQEKNQINEIDPNNNNKINDPLDAEYKMYADSNYRKGLRASSFFSKTRTANEAFKNAGFDVNLNVKNENFLSSFVIAYALGMKNMNLEDIKALSSNAKKKLGEEVLNEVSAHPINSDDPEKNKESAKWYATVYKNAMTHLKNLVERMPSDTFDSVEKANKFRSTYLYGYCVWANHLMNTIPKEFQKPVHKNEVNFNNEFVETYGNSFLNDFSITTIGGMYYDLANRMANPNNSLSYRVASKALGMAELNTEFGADLMFSSNEEKNRKISSEFSQYDKTENRDKMKSIYKVKETQDGLTDEECKAFLNGGSLDNLIRTNTEVTVKVYTKLQEMYPENTNLKAGFEKAYNAFKKEKALNEAYEEAKNSDELKVVISKSDFLDFDSMRSRANYRGGSLSEDFDNQIDAERLAHLYEMMDRSPKAFEYSPDIRKLPVEIRNSGNLKDVVKYFNTNQKTMTMAQKLYVLKRARILQKVADIQKSAEEDTFDDKYVSGKKEPLQEGRMIDIGVRLKAKQSSNNGCWSCGLHLMLQAHGINVSQEDIRAYRPDYSTEEMKSEKFKNDVDSELISDGAKNIFDMGEAGLAFAPDKMLRSVELIVPGQAQKYMPNGKKIDEDRYIENGARAMEQKIKEILLVEKSPISFTDGYHYWAIKSIEDGYVELIDSNSTNPSITTKKRVRDIVEDALVDKGWENPARNLSLVWMSDIELKPDGKTFYNVPSNYVEMNSDGTLKRPPQDIQEDADMEKSKIEKDTFRVRLYGGKDDVEADRIERNPLTSTNLLIVENAILPKKVNAKRLTRIMQQRDNQRRQELEELNQNLIGKGISEAEKQARYNVKDFAAKIKEDEKKVAAHDEKIRKENRVTEFKYETGLYEIKENEKVNEAGKKYLWAEPGAEVAFRVQLAYESFCQLYDYKLKNQYNDKYVRDFKEIQAEYKKLMNKLSKPENAITDEVKPDAYKMPGYFKSVDNIVDGINFLDKINNHIMPGDFGFKRTKFLTDKDYAAYNPTVLGACAEGLKELTDARCKANILKACTKNEKFYKAVRDVTTLPSNSKKILNTRRSGAKDVISDYFSIQRSIVTSFIHGTPDYKVEAVAKEHDKFVEGILKPESKTLVSNTRNYYEKDVIVERENENRAKRLEDVDQFKVEHDNKIREIENYPKDKFLNVEDELANFFGPDSNYTAVLEGAGLETHDSGVFGHLMIYAIGELGMKPTEIIGATPERKKEIGTKFLEDIGKHPIFSEASGKLSVEEYAENQKWYARNYKKAHEAFDNQERTYPDDRFLSNHKSMTEYRKSDAFFFNEILDRMLKPEDFMWRKDTEPDEKNPGVNNLECFMEGYGPKEQYGSTCNRLRTYKLFTQIVDEVANQKNPLEKRVYYKLFGEMEILSKVRGKKYGEAKLFEDTKKQNKWIRGRIDDIKWGRLINFDEQKKLTTLFNEDEMQLFLENPLYAVAELNPQLAVRMIEFVAEVSPQSEMGNLAKAMAQNGKEMDKKVEYIKDHFAKVKDEIEGPELRAAEEKRRIEEEQRKREEEKRLEEERIKREQEEQRKKEEAERIKKEEEERKRQEEERRQRELEELERTAVRNYIAPVVTLKRLDGKSQFEYEMASKNLAYYLSWKGKVVEQLDFIYTGLQAGELEGANNEPYVNAVKRAFDDVMDNSKTPKELNESFAALYAASQGVSKSMESMSQNLLMSHNTVRRWFDGIEMKTEEGRSFKNASIGDIATKLNNISKEYDLKAVGNPDIIYEVGENLEKGASKQQAIIREIMKKYGVEVNVLISKKSPDEYVSIKERPSTLDMAKHYLITRWVDELMDLNVINTDGALDDIMKSVKDTNAFKRDAKSLSEDPLFKAISKKSPNKIYTEWNKVEQKSPEEKAELLNNMQAGAQMGH